MINSRHSPSELQKIRTEINSLILYLCYKFNLFPIRIVILRAVQYLQMNNVSFGTIAFLEDFYIW